MYQHVKPLALLALTSALFIGGVEWLVGWRSILATWQSLSLSAQCITLLLLVISYAIRTTRIYDYYYVQLNGHWWACARLTLTHNALNNLLPMRSGEISFPLLMRSMFGVGMARSVPGLLVMRVLDLYVLLMLAAFSLPLFALSDELKLTLVGGLCLLPLLAFPLRTFMLRQILPKRRSKLFRLLIKLLAGTPRGFASYLRCYLYGWANWGLKLALLAWLLTAFTGVGFPGNLLGAMGGELTSVLPVNPPGGLGAYEAGVVAALTPFYNDSQQALNAAVNIHLFILIASIISALLASATIRYGSKHVDTAC